jgi:hypothetical protein
MNQQGFGSRNLAQSGSTMSLNPDPDTDPNPQQYCRRQIFSKIKKSTKKSKILAVCTIFIPFPWIRIRIPNPDPDPESH